MRFDRYYKGEFADTDGKRAAAALKQRREVAALPLFGEQVKAAQPSIDSIMEARSKDFSRTLSRDRKRIADKWLCARYLLKKMPPADAQMLREYWKTCKWPGTPSYFLTMLDMFNNGQLPGFDQRERRAA